MRFTDHNFKMNCKHSLQSHVDWQEMFTPNINQYKLLNLMLLKTVYYQIHFSRTFFKYFQSAFKYFQGPWIFNSKFKAFQAPINPKLATAHSNMQTMQMMETFPQYHNISNTFNNNTFNILMTTMHRATHYTIWNEQRVQKKGTTAATSIRPYY